MALITLRQLLDHAAEHAPPGGGTDPWRRVADSMACFARLGKLHLQSRHLLKLGDPLDLRLALQPLLLRELVPQGHLLGERLRRLHLGTAELRRERLHLMREAISMHSETHSDAIRRSAAVSAAVSASTCANAWRVERRGSAERRSAATPLPPTAAPTPWAPLPSARADLARKAAASDLSCLISSCSASRC